MFSALLRDNTDKTIAILGDKWLPRKANRKGVWLAKGLMYLVICTRYGNNVRVLSTRMLKVSLPGMGTMLRVEKDAPRS